MAVPAPHYFLFSQASRNDSRGEWSFVLTSADGAPVLEAADAEPEARGERLELLAVIRGLEAIDQPSHVTLVTPSRYVNRGIAYGLEEWGRNGWTWERFGEMVPVKNRDLWQRLDRARRIHQIDGPIYRRDAAHKGDQAAWPTSRLEAPTAAEQQLARIALWRRLLASCRRWVADRLERLWLSCAQFGTSLLPSPWFD